MVTQPGVIRLAVFGSPVAHSHSPFIHQAFARQLGLSVDYQAIEARQHEFAARLDQLAAAGGRGCNVTLPLKHAAWEMARRSSPAAERARAANTLVFEQPGDWFADNTDGRGLVRDLARHLGQSLFGQRILILGAGGAAAGILGDLLEQQPAAICIGNRTPERAERLARSHAARGQISTCALDRLDTLGPFELVINATSAGHGGRHPLLPEQILTATGWCYDLNYGAAAKPLRQYCAAAGLRYQDGLGMLVEQAALSFTLWTGTEPDGEPVLQALRGRETAL